jgi:hypothetical protein
MRDHDPRAVGGRIGRLFFRDYGKGPAPGRFLNEAQPVGSGSFQGKKKLARTDGAGIDGYPLDIRAGERGSRKNLPFREDFLYEIKHHCVYTKHEHSK